MIVFEQDIVADAKIRNPELRSFRHCVRFLLGDKIVVCCNINVRHHTLHTNDKLLCLDILDTTDDSLADDPFRVSGNAVSIHPGPSPHILAGLDGSFSENISWGYHSLLRSDHLVGVDVSLGHDSLIAIDVSFGVDPPRGLQQIRGDETLLCHDVLLSSDDVSGCHPLLCADNASDI